MLHDGGGGSKPAAKPAVKTRAQIEAEERSARAAAALRKLQTSGANSLTNAERAVLGMAPAGTNSPPPPAPAAPAPAAPAPAPTPTTAAPVAASPATNTPAPVPPAPQQDVVATPVPAVRSAPIDTVEFIDEKLSDELIIDLLFENVGGQELLTIARNDTVNGQDVVYQPFKNLGILQEAYNPTNLLRLQQTSDKFFSNFTINLRNKIPNVGSGENGKNYKLDLATGEGIIEFINIKPDEQVEVQILSAGIIEDINMIESTES